MALCFELLFEKGAALQVIHSHKHFLQRSLSGTILKSKMVRNLTELKVLVYDFSKASKRLDIPEEDYTEQEAPRRAGELVCILHTDCGIICWDNGLSVNLARRPVTHRALQDEASASHSVILQ